MNKFDKLYSVSSIMPTFDTTGWYIAGSYSVSVDWFRADKVRGGFQYSKIIEGYNDMTPEDQRFYEFLVNYLFTFDEVESLRHFIKKELENDLYVDYEIDPTKPVWEQEYYGPCREVDPDADGTIYLNMLENYNLPFEVRGYFDKQEGNPIMKHLSADKLMKPVTKD